MVSNANAEVCENPSLTKHDRKRHDEHVPPEKYHEDAFIIPKRNRNTVSTVVPPIILVLS